MSVNIEHKPATESAFISGLNGKSVAWLDRLGDFFKTTMTMDTIEVPRCQDEAITADPQAYGDQLAERFDADVTVVLWDNGDVGAVAVIG
jgi:hypothetical protein